MMTQSQQIEYMCYTHVTWITHKHKWQCEHHNKANVGPLKILYIQHGFAKIVKCLLCVCVTVV